jgi:hypothetical protein
VPHSRDPALVAFVGGNEMRVTIECAKEPVFLWKVGIAVGVDNVDSFARKLSLEVRWTCRGETRCGCKRVCAPAKVTSHVLFVLY